MPGGIHKRLFLGVRPDSELLQDLINYQQELRQSEPFLRLKDVARWIADRNLHLTLHFLGGVDEGRIPELKAALAELVLPRRCDQPLAHLVGFPKRRHARVLSVGDQRVAVALRETWELVAGALRRLELPVENRDYYPHISLARFRRPVDLGDLSALAPGETFTSLKVEAVTLYESHTGGHGSEYERLAEFPLSP